MARKKQPRLETESEVPPPSDLTDGPELEPTAWPVPAASDQPDAAPSEEEIAAQVIEAAKGLELPVDVPPVVVVNTVEQHEVTKELYAELLRKMDVATKVLSLQNLASSDWRKKARERLQEARNAMRFLDI